MSDTAATKGDIVPPTILISVLGKLLIEKGYLKRDEIVGVLEATITNLAASDAALTAQLKNLIEIVQNW